MIEIILFFEFDVYNNINFITNKIHEKKILPQIWDSDAYDCHYNVCIA